ncbi:LysR substrate-binding domain-containing protein [Rhizobium sp. L1K21]|uniref:LysR substrate-binding domain-containing protein n=1 Tax=Rhizobium sp. L1K21 TaxID=2954933 RepID=UPI002092701A|nr:LysR substrate-binding domain-containing protein [Rhizobium sp. L1K21]MCO6188632.1 LysR substrate-binding domain-containing protein [Rhizobium sp. L1K21]
MLPAIHLPSLAVLRCFEAAAKHESFTAAAEELSLTQGAVSRHIRELEDQIGAALFRREGRGVRLTDAGRTFARELFDDLERLRRTISHAVAAGSTTKLLSIAVLPTFGSRWLMPRLPEFKNVRDDLELFVYSRSEPFDLSAAGIDLAIHTGGEEWPGAQLTPLCPEGLVAVAAPQLVHKFGDTPRDLFNMPLLHMSSRPLLWENFRQTLAGVDVPARKGSYFDQFALVIAAAIAGMGAAILPTYLIESEIQSGTLRQISVLPDSFGRNYYIATPAGQTKPLATQFANWLKKQVSRPLR